jgi:methylenetetrahydrofolate reductase (NADPH)
MGRGVSILATKIGRGAFVVTAEMPVIDGGGKAEVNRQLDYMAAYLDAVNATDNAAAHAHCSPLALSLAILQHGVEPIMQLTCRDRNRLALEADLVGAAMHGVTNVCCLTGDDVSAGDEPEARPVFDLDGIQLIRLAGTIAGGHYLSGRALEPAPELFIGAVENPGAPPLDYRPRRAMKKALAGARFLQLQICFHPERLADFMAACVAAGVTERCAILPSVIIVRSANALRFIDEQVPGIAVPAETIERVAAADDQLAACEDLAVELAEHALAVPGVAGIHFISFRRDAGIARVCQRLGIATREERERVGDRPFVQV